MRFSAARLSPRDSRRKQPTVAAAAHARLAQYYAVCSRQMASRHAPTHSVDANMRLSPVTARRRRQAVPCRQTHPLASPKIQRLFMALNQNASVHMCVLCGATQGAALPGLLYSVLVVQLEL